MRQANSDKVKSVEGKVNYDQGLLSELPIREKAVRFYMQKMSLPGFLTMCLLSVFQTFLPVGGCLSGLIMQLLTNNSFWSSKVL